MSFRFFRDFDDFFGDDVTFSLLPLRMTDDSMSGAADQKQLCKSKDGGRCVRSMGWASRLASMDVSDTDKDCTVHVDLPGIRKEDIQVHFDEANRLLTVEAERKAEFKECSSDCSSENKNAKAENKQHQPQFYHHERYYGKIQRSLMLPENVDGQNVQASMENGVLTLVFGKKPEKDTRQKIEIN